MSPPSVYCAAAGVFQGDRVRSCGVPCPCHPAFGGSAPSNGVGSDATGALCSFYNATINYVSAGETADWCFWQWSQSGSPLVTLYRLKNDATFGAFGCETSAVAGEYVLQVQETSTVLWIGITEGFSCDPETGKISGTHTFDTRCGSISDCGQDFTFTVPV